MKNINTLMKKLMLFLVFTIIILPNINSLLSTTQVNYPIDLIQTCNNCTYCNLTSIKYPNGTNILTNQIMSSTNNIEYNFTLNKTYTSDDGTYKYCYNCGNAVEKVTGCINFDITLSGDPTPEGISFLLFGIIIIIFGVSIFFLILTNYTEEPGFKIFFILLSFVFLLGTIIIISIIATDSNLTSGINKTISVILFSIGMIFFVFFVYIMINQTKNILNMMQEKKGYEVY